MNFFVIFAIIYVVGVLFMSFAGFYVLQNFYLTLALIALVLALFIKIILTQEDRIEKLEKRLDDLEKPKEQENSDITET